MKYHYVYRITNKRTNKHYYGSRSSDNLPHKDIGVTYFSSSFDTQFISDQQENPDNYKYKIIKIFTTKRNDAIKLEIKLHEKFNVGLNPNFYNRVKQTSSKFDTTGVNPWNKGMTMPEEFRNKLKGPRSYSEETRALLSKNQKENLLKNGHPRQGITLTDKTKNRISKGRKGKCIGEENHFYGKTHSEESKQKIKENHIGMTGKTHSDKTKKKMSKPKSEETKLKMKEAFKKRKKGTCTYCKKQVPLHLLNRWHNDNCKEKQ